MYSAGGKNQSSELNPEYAFEFVFLAQNVSKSIGLLHFVFTFWFLLNILGLK
jgi:hypothetical protein